MIAAITTSQFLGVQIAVRSTDRRSLTVRSAASPRISASAAHSAAHPRTAGNALAASISLYDVLGVPVGATCQEIKAAYRRLARACHPDVAAGSTDEFMRVNAAYSTLSDPVKRADYDRGLIVASGSPRRYPAPPPSPSPNAFAGRGRRTWETDQCW
ncbi:hypothetical protein QJS04_geneDACA009596 [Acorus gramineus]|uniref:J domain-containing protein n=1 Tax=Acorus gramineus TaxID=55184 RepID=A0AAV9B9N7_ACOGR|nr:hypothetical protein QJS04_geneDACA009596 [Acorus gramineus]